jgi:hypothetical protein
MTQVQASYDFSAQPGSGELSIQEGEILTVIRDVSFCLFVDYIRVYMVLIFTYLAKWF